MPKKRSQGKSFKPFPTLSAAPATSSSSTDRLARTVNELLADLRISSSPPLGAAPLPAPSPSVPPSIREILQIPETPAPRPRRATRQRYDGNGRRLPAGPPPPRSWLSVSTSDLAEQGTASQARRLDVRGSDEAPLPGTYVPQIGSLVDIVLQRLAINWDFHQVYDQYHVYYAPGHLKAGLIRWIGLLNDRGVTISDLKLLLLPPPDEEETDVDLPANIEVTYLELSGSLGHSIKLKDVTTLLFPSRGATISNEPGESWDADDVSPSPPRVLLPNLTHLSLALHPFRQSGASWKSLLSLALNLPGITHLSLAYWPEPCFTPRASMSFVTTPQGRSIPYGGTSYYSHSLDHDWSEAALILRMLSSRLYALEYLDLTGCSTWFKALMTHSEHDFVDWTNSWGKITFLKLRIGWRLGVQAMASDRAAYEEAVDVAVGVEKYIRAQRAGRGKFITVETDEVRG